MSPSRSKFWYFKNCLHFSKRAVPLEVSEHQYTLSLRAKLYNIYIGIVWSNAVVVLFDFSSINLKQLFLYLHRPRSQGKYSYSKAKAKCFHWQSLLTKLSSILCRNYSTPTWLGLFGTQIRSFLMEHHILDTNAGKQLS